jgi:hypothetical protein
MKTVVQALKVQERQGFWLLSAAALASVACLVSCAPTTNKASLAPPPPEALLASLQAPSARPTVFAATELSKIETASGFPVAIEDPAALALKQPTRLEQGCSVKDRFDRKYAIAYQWGMGGQNKIGLDVDGVGIGGDIEGARLEYVLRLQADVPRKERCRNKSNWQGIVPTGYHELFVRETDTVWGELRKLTDDVDSRLDTLFDD